MYLFSPKGQPQEGWLRIPFRQWPGVAAGAVSSSTRRTYVNRSAGRGAAGLVDGDWRGMGGIPAAPLCVSARAY